MQILGLFMYSISIKQLDLQICEMCENLRLPEFGGNVWTNTECIKMGLAGLGMGLNRLLTLSLAFSKRQRSDESGFPFITKYLPKDSKLERITIDLTNDKESSYAISEIFEEDLTQISDKTTVKFDQIMIDAPIVGLKQFPLDFIQTSRINSPCWGRNKDHL